MSYIKSSFTFGSFSFTDVVKVLKELATWNNKEFAKLEVELKTPEFRGIQFETLNAIPSKYKEGDLYYFSDLSGLPASPGLYIREATSWRKL